MTEQIYKQASNEQLAEEARQLDYGLVNSRGWVNAPEAIPRVKESIQISLRLPSEMLEILKVFAEREKIGYQVLLKQWLDDRIKIERDKIVKTMNEPQTQSHNHETTPELTKPLFFRPTELTNKVGIVPNSYLEPISVADTSKSEERINKVCDELSELKDEIRKLNANFQIHWAAGMFKVKTKRAGSVKSNLTIIRGSNIESRTRVPRK